MKRVESPPIDGAPVVMVTGTKYKRNDLRYDLARTTVKRCVKDHELPCVVVDASPDPLIAKDLGQLGAAVVCVKPEEGGIPKQRQIGARCVLDQGGNKIITSEPEKTGMPDFAEEISRMLDEFSVVVIGRTERSKESMPPFQRRTEELAGWVLERTLGLPPDALAGPRGYSRQGIQHLLRYPSDRPGMNNWIYMYDNPLAARANGERVGAIEVDLIYPESQVEQETDNPTFDRKRYEQFALQLDYLLRRPEVKQPAYDLRNMVLGRLALMSEQPTDKEIKEFFNTLEAEARGFGYKNNKDTQYLSL